MTGSVLCFTLESHDSPMLQVLLPLCLLKSANTLSHEVTQLGHKLRQSHCCLPLPRDASAVSQKETAWVSPASWWWSLLLHLSDVTGSLDKLRAWWDFNLCRARADLSAFAYYSLSLCPGRFQLFPTLLPLAITSHRTTSLASPFHTFLSG